MGSKEGRGYSCRGYTAASSESHVLIMSSFLSETKQNLWSHDRRVVLLTVLQNLVLRRLKLCAVLCQLIADWCTVTRGVADVLLLANEMLCHNSRHVLARPFSVMTLKSTGGGICSLTLLCLRMK